MCPWCKFMQSTHSSIFTKFASTIPSSETSSKFPCLSLATKYRIDSMGPLVTCRTSWMQTLASGGSVDPVRLPITVRAHLVNSVKVCSCSGFGNLVGWMVVQQNRWFDILAVCLNGILYEKIACGVGR